jgi:hypothetical protein
MSTYGAVQFIIALMGSIRILATACARFLVCAHPVGGPTRKGRWPLLTRGADPRHPLHARAPIRVLREAVLLRLRCGASHTIGPARLPNLTRSVQWTIGTNRRTRRKAGARYRGAAEASRASELLERSWSA